MAKKRKRTGLPRVTLLAYSHQELMRFSLAADMIVSCQHALMNLCTRLEDLIGKLEMQTDRRRRPSKPAAADGKEEKTQEKQT